MVKKRIIGVVTVKNNWVVQSFGYNRYLPIGRPECVIQNLDRWGADEILVQVIDRSINSLGPNFDLLRRIGGLSLSTPLIYAGGIRNVSEAVNVIKHGADRLVLDYMLRNNRNSVFEIAASLGSQAVIASLPLVIEKNELKLYNYNSGILQNIDTDISEIINDKRIISEILLIDKKAEGYPNSYNLDILNLFPYADASFIAFGGISDSLTLNKLLNKANVSAVAIGNFLNYTEHAIQKFKELGSNNNLRNPEYQTNNY